MSKSRLGIFAKHWTPGLVKTRLADGIGAEQAASFHRACVDTLLARLHSVADHRVICYWPAHERESYAAIVPTNWELEPQTNGDLGERIQVFFEKSFAIGFDRVVLLGTDSPNVPLCHIQRAMTLLRDHRLVLGPTEDGGYYVVGAYKKTPPIFKSMPWSSPELWSSTLRQLDAEGWQRAVDYELLPRWYDVDTRDDLRRLHRELLLEAIGDEVLTKLRKNVEIALNVADSSVQTGGAIPPY